MIKKFYLISKVDQNLTHLGGFYRSFNLDNGEKYFCEPS